MKFHEALRKAVRQFGINVLQEHRLMSVLADYKAFDDYPAVKEVMKAISTEGHGKELCRLASDGSDAECLSYADDMKESLVRNSSFREEFAQYAAESLAFALGLRTSVQEPSDHGFEAVRRKNEPERAVESGRSRQSAETGVQAAPQHTEKGSASPKPAGKDPAAWPGASGNYSSQSKAFNGSARSAQTQDDPEALYSLGENYYTGRSVRQDYSKAAEYYWKAAAYGHAEAQFRLGCMYQWGQGVNENLSEAFSLCRKAAEQGYAPAERQLGFMYYSGTGVPKDYSMAARWYRKAADQGDHKAETWYEKILKLTGSGNGAGEPGKGQDDAANEHADTGAAFLVGENYYYGRCVPQNYAKAAEYYSKAARYGRPEAQFRLGCMYQWGQGVSENLSEAYRLCRSAAEHGYAPAQHQLGFMYHSGIGVKKDYSMAAFWYRKAADQGDVKAETLYARVQALIQSQNNGRNEQQSGTGQNGAASEAQNSLSDMSKSLRGTWSSTLSSISSMFNW